MTTVWDLQVNAIANAYEARWGFFEGSDEEFRAVIAGLASDLNCGSAQIQEGIDIGRQRLGLRP